MTEVWSFPEPKKFSFFQWLRILRALERFRKGAQKTIVTEGMSSDGRIFRSYTWPHKPH